VKVKIFPPKKTPFEMIFDHDDDDPDEAAVAAVMQGLKALQPLVRQVRMMGIANDPGVLTMPPVDAHP